jgi:hypothetical protein
MFIATNKTCYGRDLLKNAGWNLDDLPTEYKPNQNTLGSTIERGFPLRKQLQVFSQLPSSGKVSFSEGLLLQGR